MAVGGPLKEPLIRSEEGVYEPSHDSELLLRALLSESDRLCRRNATIVEIGSGSGYVSAGFIVNCIASGRHVPYVVLTDISPKAVSASLLTLKLNDIHQHADVVQCDSSSCLRAGSADVVFFNPPYLPVNERNDWIGYAWSGGEEGVEMSLKFFSDGLRICKRNSCLLMFVVSTLQNVSVLYEKIRDCNAVEVFDGLYFFFERIHVLICRM